MNKSNNSQEEFYHGYIVLNKNIDMIGMKVLLKKDENPNNNIIIYKKNKLTILHTQLGIISVNNKINNSDNLQSILLKTRNKQDVDIHATTIALNYLYKNNEDVRILLQEITIKNDDNLISQLLNLIQEEELNNTIYLTNKIAQLLLNQFSKYYVNKLEYIGCYLPLLIDDYFYIIKLFIADKLSTQPNIIAEIETEYLQKITIHAICNNKQKIDCNIYMVDIGINKKLAINLKKIFYLITRLFKLTGTCDIKFNTCPKHLDPIYENEI